MGSSEEEEKKRQIELNLKLAPNKKRPNQKHVSRACLQCRKRHFKCDGLLPLCDRCVKAGKVCTYVESHRGGLRKKGVSVKKMKESPPGLIPDMEDFSVPSRPSPGSPMSDKAMLDALYKFPCLTGKDGKCANANCPTKMAPLRATSSASPENPTTSGELEIVNGPRRRKPNCKCGGTLSPVLRDIKEMDFSVDIETSDHLLNPDTFDRRDIIANYYRTFHRFNPLLPPLEEIDTYLENPLVALELLFIMKIIADGQMNTLYSDGSSAIGDVLAQCLNIVKFQNANDLITIQVLLLVSVVAHISSLHDLSKQVRHLCISMLEELQIDNIDGPIVPDTQQGAAPLKVYTSPRLQHISRESIADNARRTYWELYYLDVNIGSADGRTLTEFAAINSNVNYPIFPPVSTFDYKTRSEAAQLVSDAVSMNIAIINKAPFESLLLQLRASLSNWELRLEDPHFFNTPYLVDSMGAVNEGIHQAMLLYNHARIFVHRPFSFLWNIKSPQNPECGKDMLKSKHLQVDVTVDSFAFETRKTIDAADSIIRILVRTNPADILKRTSLFACSLALASLVHLSSYIWIENLQKSKDIRFTGPGGFGDADLRNFSKSILMSITALHQISLHWNLSGKLGRHIRESLHQFRPKLYSEIKDLLPQIEMSITKMRLSDEEPDDEKCSAHLDRDTRASSYGDTEDHSESRPSSLFDNQSDKYLDSQVGHINSLNNLISVEGDNYEYYDSGDISPISDTGCDWIDKALLDFA